MKKIFLFAVIAFLALGTMAYAENSASSYSSVPTVGEMPVYVQAYNPNTTAISSNNIVILDISDASNAAKSATGAVINTTTTSDSVLVYGVTDQVIPAMSGGRVCVRGPHKVLLLTSGNPALAGAPVSTSTTAGWAVCTSTTNVLSVAGKLMNVQPDPKRDANGCPSENGSSYWMWIGKL